MPHVRVCPWNTGRWPEAFGGRVSRGVQGSGGGVGPVTETATVSAARNFHQAYMVSPSSREYSYPKQHIGHACLPTPVLRITAP